VQENSNAARRERPKLQPKREQAEISQIDEKNGFSILWIFRSFVYFDPLSFDPSSVDPLSISILCLGILCLSILCLSIFCLSILCRSIPCGCTEKLMLAVRFYLQNIRQTSNIFLCKIKINSLRLCVKSNIDSGPGNWRFS
jgi:hypothetical protein